MATYRNEGERIDYTPGGAISAGDVVVQEDIVGVATDDIAASVQGSLAVTGVFAFTKGTGSSSALAVGTKVYWNDTSDIVSTSSGDGKYIGKVVAAAIDSVSTVDVRMGQA